LPFLPVSLAFVLAAAAKVSLRSGRNVLALGVGVGVGVGERLTRPDAAGSMHETAP